MDKKNILPVVIGLALLGVLFYTLGPSNIINALLKTNLLYFAFSLVPYFICDIMSGISLNILFPHARLKDLVLCHMCGMLYSALTPGRAGYYYVAYSLSKKHGKSISSGAGLLTLMQAINFFLKVIFSVTAVLYFSYYIASEEVKQYLLLASLAPVVLIMAIVLFLYTDLPLKVLRGKNPMVLKIKSFVASMQESTRKVKKTSILKIMGIACIGWLMMGLMMYLITESMGLNLSYIQCLMMHPLLSALMFIPFVPAGLGLTETGSALLFKIIGFTTSDGVAFMLLFRLGMIIVDSVGVVDMKLMEKPHNK